MGKINYKLIDKYDYVSFDIFDTLLKRMLLTSNNVFCVVANIYKKKYGKELPDFETKRTTIEFSLWKKTKEGKFTLNHIYKELENIYPKEVCIRLKNIELEVEKI